MAEPHAWYRVTLKKSTPGPPAVVLDLGTLGQASFDLSADEKSPKASSKVIRLSERTATQLRADSRTWEIKKTSAPKGRAVFDRLPNPSVRKRSKPVKPPAQNNGDSD